MSGTCKDTHVPKLPSNGTEYGRVPLPHPQGPSHTFKAPPTPSRPSHTFKAPPIPSRHPRDPSVPPQGKSGQNLCSLRLECHI